MMLTSVFSEFSFSFKLSWGDLEQNRSKWTKRGTFKRTKRDFEKIPAWPEQ
jgi:hypothetical protein